MDVFILLLLLFYGQLRTASTDPPAPSLDLSSTQTRTVRLGENITMSCNITEKHEVSWYRLNSRLEELTLLIHGEKTRTRKSLPFSYNTDEKRFILTANSEITEARLTVREVQPDDLGFYFCGTKADFYQMYFARPIRLQLKDQKSKQDQTSPENGVKDGVSAVERVMMLVGVGAVALVFLLASIAAGWVIHRRSWRSGWAAGIDAAQRRSLKK
ncbi:uncharacterized protein LOC111189069 [Astyanax mexicanus]|uniref:uncharacterized protein LOC111189069 n=1 Tax=Astyanax mexicanus TaxID=7994 RepID=UPI0020CB058D|nr:uncharacterized protein LOC111189069 [Astyanax mexicanus]